MALSTGRIVARNLPSEYLEAKPVHRHVDPGKLVEGTGPLHLRLSTPRLYPSVQHEDTATTALSVYCYPRPDGEPVVVQMNRQSTEPASDSLRRLGLSLSKKLLAANQNKKQKQAKVIPEPPTVWSHVDGACTQQLDVSGLSCAELWHEATQSPLAVQVSLPEAAPLILLVEAGNPSISVVRTFGDFTCHLYPGVPTLLEVETRLADDCRVDWFADGRLVHADSRLFVPEECHIGSQISVLVTPHRQDHDGAGCEEAYEFTVPVQPRPDNYLLAIRSPRWKAPPEHHLRVVSYNILADQNAFDYSDPSKVASSYEGYCTTDVLKKERRLPLILHELLAYHASVLCLQEVDESIYEAYLQPVLRELGYEGRFDRKRNEGNREGCALFWNVADFEEVLEQQPYCISALVPTTMHWPSDASILAMLDERPDVREVLIDKLGHVLQVVSLRQGDTTIHVANTHLFYHPLASHFRLLQVYACCQQLERVLERQPGHVVLCGDLNSSLESAPGSLLIHRRVEANYRSLQTHLNSYDGSSKTAATTTDFPSVELPDSFPVLHEAVQPRPLFSHFVGGLPDGFCDHLDHVLTTCECVGSAELPSLEEVVERYTALPSAELPSDHVSLVCDLKVR